MALAFPLINGNRFDYTSIEVIVAGVPYRGVKAVNYSDSLDKAKQYGTSARSLGKTRGKYDADGSLEIFKEEAIILRGALAAQAGGDGWGEVDFTLTVAYAEAGQSVTVDTLQASVQKVEDGHAQGNEGLTEKWTLTVLEVKRSGLSLLSKLAQVK
jgi:hypothetical protein